MLESQFGIESFFRPYVVVGIYAYTSDVFAKVFLGDGGITVTLAETGTQEAVIGQLVVQPGTEHGAERNLAPENLCVGFPVVLVYPVVFGTYTGRYAEAVPEALVVLHIGGNIVTLMYFFRFAGEGADMFVSQARGDLCTAVPFLVELIVQIIVVILVRPCR